MKTLSELLSAEIDANTPLCDILSSASANTVKSMADAMQRASSSIRSREFRELLVHLSDWVEYGEHFVGNRDIKEKFLIRTVFNCSGRASWTKSSGKLVRGLRKPFDKFKEMDISFVGEIANNKIRAKGKYRSKYKLQSWSKNEKIANLFQMSGAPGQQFKRGDIGFVLVCEPPADKTLNIENFVQDAGESEVIVYNEGTIEVDVIIDTMELLRAIVAAGDYTMIIDKDIVSAIGKKNADILINTNFYKKFKRAQR
jgi:hypothetical protein